MADLATIEIRQRLTALRVSQWILANTLSVGQGTLNQWLNGIRPMPEGIEARIHAALDEIAEEKRVAAEAVAKLRAERAAQEARERGLAGTTEGTE